ncbi:hypothetical protein FSP39_014543 [Pinctada imbricata]|uniref:G-protein coupled receptors family 1 profile domain-containing protein n=1 Tax=Pinctada imbricata TaxID=66713 RepID=A0AA89C6J9_PINIB|nr:hypothetical protein FSP39_014543 [Pinctada imbricata]
MAENVTIHGDVEFALQQWNRDLVQRYPWNPVVFLTLLTIGIVGNGTVMFIYRLRMKKKMEERFFIPILACMDFVACVFLCSFAIYQSFKPVTISSAPLCKSMMYLQHASSACSLFMLLAIAFQRYKMVCRPFQRQMGQSMKYVAIGLAVTCGYLLFIPHVFLSNIVTVDSDIPGLHGQRCTTAAYTKTERTLQISYRLVIFCVFLLTIIIMSLLYSLIAKTIIHRMRLMKSPMSPVSPRATTERYTRAKSITGPAALKKGDKEVFTFDSLRRKRRHFVTNRYSYMFMTITAMAVISYIVPIILAISTGSSGTDVEKSLTYFIFKRLFVLSHIVNPFIYGAFDHTFREHMGSLCVAPVGRRESRSTVNSIHSSD